MPDVEPVFFFTPWKIKMEPENDGLEDDFPFQMGVFSGSMLIFRGVNDFTLDHYCTLGCLIGFAEKRPLSYMIYPKVPFFILLKSNSLVPETKTKKSQSRSSLSPIFNS